MKTSSCIKFFMTGHPPKPCCYLPASRLVVYLAHSVEQEQGKCKPEEILHGAVLHLSQQLLLSSQQLPNKHFRRTWRNEKGVYSLVNLKKIKKFLNATQLSLKLLQMDNNAWDILGASVQKVSHFFFNSFLK